MKALVFVITKWAHTLRNFARLNFCDGSVRSYARKKNDVNIGIYMENGQEMIKKKLIKFQNLLKFPKISHKISS